MTVLLLLCLQGDRVDEMVRSVTEERLRKTLEKLVSFETRNSFSETESDKRGIGAARKWIKEEFEAIARTSKSPMTVEFHDFTLKGVAQKNVFAMLKGTKHPKRVVVFGGHYDTINLKDKDPNAIAPGANDDGSGTVAVIEAARILSMYNFDCSIIFVAFSSEEQGLHGSKAFAEFLKKSDFEVVAMLNNDIVGGVNESKDGKNEKDVRCFSDPKHEPSRQFARWAKLVAEPRVKGFTLKLQETADRPGRGGDHQSFNRAGFTAIRLIESHENLDHQHSPTDTMDRIKFDYFRKVAQLDVAIVATLAGAPEAPVAESGKDGVVRWKAVPGAAGYRVAMRRGGVEFAEIIATKETSYRVEAKDVTVSVAAVDAEGDWSLFSPELKP